MRTTSLPIKRVMALVLAGMLAAAPALAKKPDDAGGPGKKHQGQGQSHQGEKSGGGKKAEGGKSVRMQDGGGGGDRPRVKVFFGDSQRTVINNYYHQEFSRGSCPPGLAKKNNGCMPPGQAKKWRMGHPLPSDVIYYDLPPRLIVDLGPPPAGHKFVRVASDILLIAVGTGMVVDAINDLGRL